VSRKQRVVAWRRQLHLVIGSTEVIVQKATAAEPIERMPVRERKTMRIACFCMKVDEKGEGKRYFSLTEDFGFI
jgi:hypothetical protein